MAQTPQTTSTLPELVVVTGAGSGLGAHIANLLAECGVIAVGFDIGETAANVKNPNYVHLRGDVTRDEDWARVAALVDSKQPRTLGLVTSAAILEVGSILEFDKQRLERTMSVNVTGTALAMRAMLPKMIERGGGAIVAVASVDATFAEQQLSVYAASKGAVRQLARTVAMDHARQGVRANVLSPGPMLAGLFERHMKSANDPEKFKATRAARQPNGEILDPRAVARAALFLLSDASLALNGAEVIADGGLTTSFDFRTGGEGASV
jgi:NAD(P)-dependent dehydrogenase (short-subunit alcohol dehydrogenase family)